MNTKSPIITLLSQSSSSLFVSWCGKVNVFDIRSEKWWYLPEIAIKNNTNIEKFSVELNQISKSRFPSTLVKLLLGERSKHIDQQSKYCHSKSGTWSRGFEPKSSGSTTNPSFANATYNAAPVVTPLEMGLYFHNGNTAGEIRLLGAAARMAEMTGVPVSTPASLSPANQNGQVNAATIWASGLSRLG